MGSRPGFLILAAGVVAGMALGEFIPFLVSVGEKFGLPLAAAGWLSSAVTVVAAVISLPLGMWLDRRRLHGFFMAGLVALGAADRRPPSPTVWPNWPSCT